MNSMEEIACILCGKDDGKVVIEENGFKGKKCESCSIIYISPRPKKQEMLNIYGHDDAYIPAHAHLESSWPKRLHARYMLDLITKHCNGGKVLEIGAGAGYFLDEARRSGFSPYAIELNPVQAQFMRTQLDIPCDPQPLSYESWKQHQFDLIYHCDVISHLHDPLAELSVMYDKLVSGGYLVFETGNLADVDPKFFPLIPAFQYPDHLFFFGRQSLMTILRSVGFNVVQEHRFDITPQLQLMGWVRRNKSSTKPNAAKIKNAFAGKAGWRNMVKNGYHSLNFALRYKLGSWTVNDTRPQTIVMIAQKP